MTKKINVAVIPARKGSKRFPGKNRATINGRNLVELAIFCAHGSEIFDHIILTTDDDYFFGLNLKYPYLKVRKRPRSVSQDNSTAFDVLMDLCNAYAYEKAIRFCYLQPTSPLRLKTDLINSIGDNSISVYYDCENKLKNSHNVVEVLNSLNLPKPMDIPTQELKNLYFNGLFYWIDLDILREQDGFLGATTKFIETPIERSYDIDYEEDFMEAKLKFMETCL